jgi:branched-subunit amino acid ABC-type transport system permease component
MHEFIELVVRGILLGATYGLVAIPISLVFITTDSIDIATGGYAALAGVVAIAVGGVIGVVAGVIAGVLAALVIGIVFAEFARRGTPDPITVALATFGSVTALASFVQWRWGEDPYVGDLFGTFWNIAGIRISPQGVLNLAIGLVILGGLYLLLYKTPLGRAMRASAVNPEAAELAGIPVSRVQFATFLAGGALAGVAGVLIAYSSGLDYTLALHLGFVALGSALIYGMSSPLRAFAGGLTLGVVEALAGGYMSGAFASTIPMIFILVMLSAGRMGGQSFAAARP